ncbi:probable LRR receptor-like serine/threonine-protein kinase At1g07650 isoform X2 [Daucus carota subsp. sativus]|uniref:probable LRR receptor-like serine/threonine-protein kinase At1g07650 isoform X2 n=1 Tax=Daucus carota subsp. sativus TaxID=79200 RepID=UPI003082E0F1
MDYFCGFSTKFFLFHVFVICYFVLIIFSRTSFVSAATAKLHQDEVRALKEIGKKLGKNDWDFSKDPCSGEGNWSIPIVRKGFESSVTCDCSFDANTTCHVIAIALKSQNLSGSVPSEFSKLHHLKNLDLSRNYLNNTIPRTWASMNLTGLSFMGNRLSGPFPKALTNIITLSNLSLEGNAFSGAIPTDIGNLVKLQKLVLSSNSFSGELPEELSNLTNLTDMRISDNNFTGKIPDFIQRWSQIEKLHMQGCSLEGPIPDSISNLKSLSDLRISDLKGKEFSFPTLSMESMKTLILRSCLISGEIPSYIGEAKNLKTIDISFNNLAGDIPSNFVNLAKADYIYLTGNKLSGPIPEWILSRNKNADISYNNFNAEVSSPFECPRGSVNLVESYSSSADKIDKVHSCLKKNFPCSAPSRDYKYFLYINCGGEDVVINNNTRFEADVEFRGASMFYSRQNWAFSSTGIFMDNDLDADAYITTNTSALKNVSASLLNLYKTARTSPVSLTYYGLCLGNGNYTVSLHFAEIVFTNDRSFNSLGKRIFDVYIQEKLVLKDFNIEAEAGGDGKPIIKNFTVAVTSHTLKIHFYWAGKGTTGIPLRGVYGPLISAIAVEPKLKGLDLQIALFTLRQIKAATKNFDPAYKLGEGGFGPVYKGFLPDGTVVAVKQLSAKSRQGNHEFITEIGMISASQHPNLVKLYGCCVEGNQLSLIYEYMENNSLSHALFGRDSTARLKLDWPTRWKICLGIARGLCYLHEESSLKIVHRDIKTSNVLLDKDLNAKISDFGLAKLNEDGNTHISTRIAGTIGYMAPEYAMRGYLTSKADVYSFGVVALEVVSGKSNTNYRPTEEFVYLLDWAYVLQERGNLLELVDPALGSEYSSEEAMVLLNVALMCTNAAPTLRPTMSQAVSMLEGRTNVQELLSDPGFSTINPKLKAIRNHFWENPTQTVSMSTEGPLADASSLSNVDKADDSVILD